MGLTVDTSVLIDFFTKRYAERFDISKEFLKNARSKPVYCPRLILAEIIVKLADLGYNFVIENFNLIKEDEIFDSVLKICRNTGSRAIDAYFIAAAKLTNSILITNDRIMANNGRKAGIEVYYLIEDFDEALKRLKEMK
uniref:PIN domain-containing protein n=1 Tax=Archaeoglobus fulgidus TaxID=2234 RepID=A0A7C3R8V0_ARCFL